MLVMVVIVDGVCVVGVMDGEFECVVCMGMVCVKVLR